MYDYSWVEKLLFGRGKLNAAKLAATLRGKCIVITGASSGIGERLAFLLGNYEVQLILIARREERLQAIRGEIEETGKATVTVVAADLRVEKELDAVLATLHGLPQGIDAIVSNAGLSIRRGLEESLHRYHDFERSMAINYFAPVRLLLSLIPVLKSKQGQIVNISTVSAVLAPVPLWAAYQSSKSAFDVWLKSMEPELHARGIAATTLYLPLVKTPMIEPTAAYRKMPAMSPDHVAAIIVQSLCTRNRRWGPWWLGLAEAGSVLFKTTIEKRLIANQAKRRTRHGNH